MTWLWGVAFGAHVVIGVFRCVVFAMCVCVVGALVFLLCFRVGYGA